MPAARKGSRVHKMQASGAKSLARVIESVTLETWQAPPPPNQAPYSPAAERWRDGGASRCQRCGGQCGGVQLHHLCQPGLLLQLHMYTCEPGACAAGRRGGMKEGARGVGWVGRQG